MRRSSLLIAMLAISFITTACATKAYNPFIIDQDDFFRQTKTIALAPIIFQINIQGEEEARSQFESLITSKLAEGGFSVVTSEKYKKIWDQKVDQQGGYFDPVTGERDESKYENIKKETIQDLSAQFLVDAVFYSAMVPVQTYFYGGVAHWDGTSQNISGSLDSTKGVSGLFKTMLSGTANMSGNLTGISLFVRLIDIHTEKDMYKNWGGIQLLGKTSSRFSTGLVSVPIDEIFSSKERNEAGVAFALNPLVRDPAQAK